MKTKYNIISHSTTGSYHDSINEKNQDAYTIIEHNNTLAIAVSDGCSSSIYARFAAAANVEAMEEMAQLNNLFNLSLKELKKIFIETVRRHLYEQPYDFRELYATLTTIFINTVSNHYIVISVGDSSAMLIDEEPHLILTPSNFISEEFTFFTNSSHLKNLVHIKTGSLSDDSIMGVAILTDGANSLVGNGVITELAHVLPEDQAQHILEDYVEKAKEADTSDDITVVMAVKSHFSEESPTFTTETVEEDTSETKTELEQEQTDGEENPILSFFSTPRTEKEITAYFPISESTVTVANLMKSQLVVYRDGYFVKK